MLNGPQRKAGHSQSSAGLSDPSWLVSSCSNTATFSFSKSMSSWSWPEPWLLPTRPCSEPPTPSNDCDAGLFVSHLR